MDLLAYQNESAHAQTFQQRLVVQNSAVAAKLLNLHSHNTEEEEEKNVEKVSIIIIIMRVHTQL